MYAVRETQLTNLYRLSLEQSTRSVASPVVVLLYGILCLNAMRFSGGFQKEDQTPLIFFGLPRGNHVFNPVDSFNKYYHTKFLYLPFVV